jgi:protein-S-isoprenylcysteine O-methyltransferase Ste14
VFLFGAFILFLAKDIRVFDLALEEKRIARNRVTLIVRRFVTMDLSIFFIETFLSNLIALVWDLMVPGWSDDMGLTVAFGFFVLIVWALLLWAWDKAGYRFSIQWFVVRWSNRLGIETDKDCFTYILKAPPGKL